MQVEGKTKEGDNIILIEEEDHSIIWYGNRFKQGSIEISVDSTEDAWNLFRSLQAVRSVD